MIRVQDNCIQVDTRTLTARFEQGALVELRSKRDGRNFVEASGVQTAPLQLIYSGQEAVSLGGELGDQVTYLPLGDHGAEIRFAAWNGDGVLAISEDPETGELVVEPSGCASRPGLRACRWNLAGIAAGLELIAPFFQGVRLPLEDELIRSTHWHWPHQWEAGLAILQGQDGGFWVHCQDDRYRYKSLQVGVGDQTRCLGLETEAYGALGGGARTAERGRGGDAGTGCQVRRCEAAGNPSLTRGFGG